MKNKKLIGQLNFIREYECKTDAEKKAINKAIKIIEEQSTTIHYLDIFSHLTDRPCSVCKYHIEGSCSKWSCVFEEGNNE